MLGYKSWHNERVDMTVFNQKKSKLYLFTRCHRGGRAGGIAPMDTLLNGSNLFRIFSEFSSTCSKNNNQAESSIFNKILKQKEFFAQKSNDALTLTIMFFFFFKSTSI